MIERRGFLKTLLVPVATAPLAASIALPKPSSNKVDELIDATKDGGLVTLYGWRFLWTGWKTTYSTMDVFSQLLMRPEGKPAFFPEDQCFYIAMPGTEGFIRRGNAVNVSVRCPQICYGDDLIRSPQVEPFDFQTHPVLINARRVMMQLAVEAMQGAAVWKFDASQACYNQWSFSWNESKLSRQSRFYLDPLKYLEQDLGLTGENVDKAYQKFFQQMYGY